MKGVTVTTTTKQQIIDIVTVCMTRTIRSANADVSQMEAALLNAATMEDTVERISELMKEQE
jgi:Mg2+ and Co2+ transporter CorA